VDVSRELLLAQYIRYFFESLPLNSIIS
jgi:hypothetical protein